jgi:hypothetical protein
MKSGLISFHLSTNVESGKSQALFPYVTSLVLADLRRIQYLTFNSRAVGNCGLVTLVALG